MMNLFQLQESLDNDATVDKIELQRKRLQIGIREGKQILTTHQVNISFYLNQSQDWSKSVEDLVSDHARNLFSECRLDYTV